jgi:hypothetical protein
MERITRKALEAVAARMNKATNSPAEPYTRNDEGKLIANVGNWHISGAYGGFSLQRMCNEGGGVHDVFGHGHMKARDLYDRMQAFLKGFDFAQRGSL